MSLVARITDNKNFHLQSRQTFALLSFFLPTHSNVGHFYYQLVIQLLDSLPTLFSKSPNVYSATGAALQAALKLTVSECIYSGLGPLGPCCLKANPNFFLEDDHCFYFFSITALSSASLSRHSMSTQLNYFTIC